ncbi:hypothetical protein L3081_00855 [Colwellia sp. MSW7]|uniref:Uncharacterized protein n=1 Tax=Colwellia maritima TaxID=2912588 RepID=A0ABS9WWC3_9GAMM|nr:hypothetical protein [Colwellia maritima]MCI2282214.1 hypothetical protein [Colwellia maritima]
MINIPVQPHIYNASAVEVITQSLTKTQLVYNFNNNNLEAKPTFFENNFIPEHWSVLSQTVKYDAQEIKIKNGTNTAVITVSYEISGSKIGSSTQFKLERLKHAMIGNDQTKLHWLFTLD